MKVKRMIRFKMHFQMFAVITKLKVLQEANSNIITAGSMLFQEVLYTMMALQVITRICADST